MVNSIVNDDAMQTARAALNGLSLRQQLISRNIANVDTPGYKAQQLDFENVLQKSLKTGNELPMAVSHNAHLASPVRNLMGNEVSLRPGGSLRADQNNVDIDTELLQMSEAGIQYQAVSQSISKKLALLQAIAQSR
ncbi:MAG: flagellar basal body rod protein FlgB [Chloroflexi bacterium HGW-Chloroflexi-10]|nr:MAG: flagellar basal body rod protein FlgB [Chloroflexi bacterium HGW-Chloroflexi-10]